MLGDESVKVGVLYNQHHAHHVIYNGGERGKISYEDWDNIIICECLAGTITDMLDLLVPAEVDVRNAEIVLPYDLMQQCHNVSGYFKRLGPTMPLGIGMVYALRDKREMGIRSPYVYSAWRERLRSRPARNFHEFVQITADFEKEMQTCKQK